MANNHKKFALIVAGGKGSRMQSETPKQFLPLAGVPILMRTIDAFYAYAMDIHLLLVLPPSDIDRWKALCEQYAYSNAGKIHLVAGGKSRFQSVKNGLNSIKGKGIVAIHDGVRPLVSVDIIASSFAIAAAKGNAIAAVRLKDSIRQAGENGTVAANRSLYRLVQTPQSFLVDLVKSAYTQPEADTMTDDASVVERAGHDIQLFEGSYDNIKITTPEDMIIAEALWQSRAKKRGNCN